MSKGIDPDVVKASAVGLRLLPMLVRSIETLFGHAPGAEKKAAVVQLANAAVFGTALGLDVSGAGDAAQVVTSLQPIISDSIDGIVASFNQHGWDAGNAQAAAAAAAAAAAVPGAVTQEETHNLKDGQALQKAAQTS